MNFNPSRLTIARKRRLLNKKALADLLALSPFTVSRWESGSSVPTAENILAISRSLGFPVEFFRGGEIDEPIGAFASFRSQTSMSALKRDAALAAGQIGFLISDWVEARFDLPAVQFPDLHLFDPESAAVALRQEWGLGERPISNMIHLLESKGGRVFSLAENTATVNAYSLWRKGKPYVFLNTFKSGESSRFDAAHELAHLVMHQDGQVTGREAEDQANRFAAAFLMPAADVIATIAPVQSLQQLIRAKVRWKISVAALNRQAHRLGLTSEWKYRDLCIELSQLGFNKSEPFGIEREVSVVWGKVVKALWAERTTHADIALELAIPESELVNLVFGVLSQELPEKRQEFRPLSLIESDHSV